MPDIKRFDNIVEAIAYLQPGHILKDCLIKDGVAVKATDFCPITDGIACP